MGQARRRCRASAPSGPALALQLHLTQARGPPERPGPVRANLPQERIDPGLEAVGTDPVRCGVVGDGLPFPQIPVTPTAFKFHRTRPSPGTRAAKARIPSIESRWAPCSGGTRPANLYRNADESDAKERRPRRFYGKAEGPRAEKTIPAYSSADRLSRKFRHARSEK